MIFKNKKIFLTVAHDVLNLCFSFCLAIWLRLENDEIFYLIKLLGIKIWIYVLIYSSSTIFFFKRFGLYQGMWKYSSIQEIISILKGLGISTLVLLSILFIDNRLEGIPRSFPFLLFIVSILSISGPRFFYRIMKDKIKNKYENKVEKIPVFIVGDGNTSELFIRATNRDENSPFKVIGIIGIKKKSIGRSIHGIPILTSVENIGDIIRKQKTPPQRIIIADHSLPPSIIESLFVFSKKNGLAIGELPKITDFKMKNIKSFKTNPIVIEDVLGRSQKIHNTSVIDSLKNKVILITGSGGSIGSELCKQINSIKPKKLILLDQSEYNLYVLMQKLNSINVICIIGDVRDKVKVELLIKTHRPDIIYHTAALKHITFVESDHLEALKTNFVATVNIAKICIKYKIPKMVFISTDKAVEPSNIMGATKRLCEKYLQMISDNFVTNFEIVRFGNVLGSTGSVVPLFHKQINEGGPITITHPEISRYFMTIREAVELVLISSITGKNENGVIKILEMGNPVKIKDLAKKMIILSGKKPEDDIKIQYTKLRAGEKLHEKLFYNDEKIEKTNQSGILQTKSKLNSINQIEINRLLKSIEKNDTSLSLKLLKLNVPEYVKIQ